MRYHHQLNFRKLLQFSPCWILMMHSLFRWEVITGDTNSGPHQNWPRYLSYKPKQKHPVRQRTTSHWYNVPHVTEMKKFYLKYDQQHLKFDLTFHIILQIYLRQVWHSSLFLIELYQQQLSYVINYAIHVTSQCMKMILLEIIWWVFFGSN